jgi:hypothetical protein
MSDLSKRLQKAMKDGGLTFRDLSRWFGRSYGSVRFWTIGKTVPWHIWAEDVEEKLILLERIIEKGKNLPIPASASSADRIQIIQALIDERDARLSRKSAAG